MEEPEPRRDAPRQEIKKTAPSIVRFAGMGIQLGVSIGLGVYVGMKLDEHMKWGQPIGTALFGLLGLASGMYLVLKALQL